jgi:hypothetical protein
VLCGTGAGERQRTRQWRRVARRAARRRGLAVSMQATGGGKEKGKKKREREREVASASIAAATAAGRPRARHSCAARGERDCAGADCGKRSRAVVGPPSGAGWDSGEEKEGTDIGKGVGLGF